MKYFLTNSVYKKVYKKPNPDNRHELWLQFINTKKAKDFEMINNAKSDYLSTSP